MKILVTGGTGMIGGPLVERLGGLNHEVIVIARSNASSLGKFSTVIQADITDETKMKEIMASIKPEIVIHLAALTSVTKCEQMPSEAFKINTYGSYNVAHAAASSGIKALIIYVSSREVYGEQTTGPTSESARPLPKNVCGITKLLGEKAIISVAENYHLPYLILRMTNVYGPSDKPRGLSSMISDAIKKGTVTVFGGEQQINFLYVKDAIDSIILACEGKTKNDIINIGSRSTVTMREFVKLLLASLEEKVMVKYDKTIEIETQLFDPSITKAGELLNYYPRYSLEEGMRETIKYFKSTHR